MAEKSLNSLSIAAIDALDFVISRHRLLEIASTSEPDDMRLLLNSYLDLTVKSFDELASTLESIKQITNVCNQAELGHNQP